MDNGQSAFDYFVSQGLAPHQAAGIVGNLQGESGQGLNPNAVNPGDGQDGSDSVGIGQWNGTRAQALKSFAASKGVPWNDLTTQLEFLHSELKGPESAAYSGLLAARTPEEAGQAMLAYERPKDWNRPGSHSERAKYAAQAFSTYGGTRSASPASAIPPQPAPIFAPQPQQQPQQRQQAEPAPIEPQQFAQPQIEPQQLARGSLFGSMPAQMAQAPPIFAPPRKQIDLSKLKLALASGNRGLFLGRG